MIPIPQLQLLGILLLLALLQIFLTAYFRTRQYGAKWNVGARDEKLPPPTPTVGRLARAQANLFETLPIFIGALLGNIFLHPDNYFSLICAEIYVVCRLIYLPLYIFGVPYIRSFIWGIGILGLIGEIALLFC
ncbi:MAG: MAPEG family protein [Zymomonas mobilis subsp. pomaceae]|uniref:MAPEG superfamily protein n=1 Tax=Zymomonas mobilis subsp. pomaceae (strain ATCC 29192 / DSM 22645 / JCM 10191 / CCUG 17912 / NBRC 13757 / NCIMB 11200 / NRRL B-4491 / Barker I) TaxID=579138 RepID=F8ESA1_ZYMMT|nr:MAPEG family protein [Zymomonas mobilis]AEI37676.1 conserved hypothetical protein [Zymomonas mobilis subsp. pomaceae ATCC 29192]MDX5949043.1 MAPEG family protein [Zymomonas mobilis subsp. pomaceae]GEB88848.1 membrane protein [Zymomonas mobilis subsp. pomaceae]